MFIITGLLSGIQFRGYKALQIKSVNFVKIIWFCFFLVTIKYIKYYILMLGSKPLLRIGTISYFYILRCRKKNGIIIYIWEGYTLKSKRIAALVILVSVSLTGCQNLTLSNAGNTATAAGTQTGITTAAGTQAGNTTAVGTATAPATTPVTQPVVTKSEDEILTEQYAGKIYPGIVISGVKLGGLTYEEAETKLKEITAKVLARKITFTAGGDSYSRTQAELGAAFDYSKALASAKTLYDNLSTQEKAEIIRTAPVNNELTISRSYSEDKLKELSKKVYNDTFRKPSIQYTGRELLRSDFEQEIKDRFAYTAKNAESFAAPMKTEAKLPSPEVSAVGTISKSYSWFDEDTVNRSFNVKRGVASINGTVIQPGEVFSFNKTVGAASLKNGYKLATVYAGEAMAEGAGGGICQVSSTLYNAVVNAGLEIVERHTHAYTVNYLPKGMDATIYYPDLDFKFRNTLDYPITIKGSATDGDLTFRFVSQKNAMGGITYKFSRELLYEGKEDWTIQYTDDLAPGKVSIVYGPHPKASVNVYRSTYKDGKFVKKELFDTVSYRNLNGLKLVGRQ